MSYERGEGMELSNILHAIERLVKRCEINDRFGEKEAQQSKKIKSKMGK